MTENNAAAAALEGAVADLIANANWAVELLTKNARPYNHEMTCQRRLVEAIGKVERAMKGTVKFERVPA